jgi:hypothetical protein
VFFRLIGGAALWVALHGGVVAADFTFAALGDTPYSAEEEPRFIGIIAELNREKLAFVVHVGDFKAAIARCSDELFLQRKEWFELIHHAFVFVPGDNEWTDCTRTWGGGHQPLERLRKLRELFFNGASSLGQRPVRLVRQRETTRGAHDYPEHARWMHERVLFVTLNAPGPDNNARAMPEEFSRRSAAIRDWLEEGFRLARDRSLRGVVVVMHANPWLLPGRPRRGFGELLATLTAVTRTFAGEVLLVHGDTHQYRVDRPLREPANGAPLANFMRVEVFGSPFVNWVRIRVTEEDGRIRFEATPGS